MGEKRESTNRSCASGWRIRYLSPPEDVLSGACDMLVKQGAITAKTLKFYPAVGGQSVLLPMQAGVIQGFEFITPVDDLIDFFPVKDVTQARPQGNPDGGNLDCGPAAAFPMDCAPGRRQARKRADHDGAMARRGLEGPAARYDRLPRLPHRPQRGECKDGRPAGLRDRSRRHDALCPGGGRGEASRFPRDDRPGARRVLPARPMRRTRNAPQFPITIPPSTLIACPVM